LSYGPTLSSSVSSVTQAMRIFKCNPKTARSRLHQDFSVQGRITRNACRQMHVRSLFSDIVRKPSLVRHHRSVFRRPVSTADTVRCAGSCLNCVSSDGWSNHVLCQRNVVPGKRRCG